MVCSAGRGTSGTAWWMARVEELGLEVCRHQGVKNHRPEYWKKESCTKRKNSGELQRFSFKYSARYSSVYIILVGKLLKARERPPERNGEKNAWCSNRAGNNAWFYKADWRTSWSVGHWVECTEEYYLSSREEWALNSTLLWPYLSNIKRRPGRIKLSKKLNCISGPRSRIFIGIQKCSAFNKVKVIMSRIQ